MGLRLNIYIFTLEVVQQKKLNVLELDEIKIE